MQPHDNNKLWYNNINHPKLACFTLTKTKSFLFQQDSGHFNHENVRSRRRKECGRRSQIDEMRQKFIGVEGIGFNGLSGNEVLRFGSLYLRRADAQNFEGTGNMLLFLDSHLYSDRWRKIVEFSK